MPSVRSYDLDDWINSLPPYLYDQMMQEAVAEAVRRKEGGYKPIGNIMRLFHGTSRECMLSGAAGTGKSRACLEYMHNMAMQYPKARLLMVRKLRASLTETGLVTFEDEVLRSGHPILEHDVTRAGRRNYVYPNGAEIIVGGVDKASKIMSSQFDFIYVQEATELSLTEWEALMTRLRNGRAPNPRLIGDCNPQSPTHWIYRRSLAGGLDLITTSHEDNPTLYDANAKTWTPKGVQYISILESLTGVRRERLRFGRWVTAEGAVYQVDQQVHFVDRFDIPSSWRKFCAVDFGFHHPFVCGWWAVDPDGRMYLYRYIYMTRRLLDEHISQILEIMAKNPDEKIEIFICDHNAQEFEIMRARGFNVRKAYKDIVTGIQAVQGRLKQDTLPDGSVDKPRLAVLRDSLVEVDADLEGRKQPYTIEQEFDAYMYARTDTGTITKEIPVKENDDAMDMTRYAVAYVDKLGDDFVGWVEYAMEQLKNSGG